MKPASCLLLSLLLLATIQRVTGQTTTPVEASAVSTLKSDSNALLVPRVDLATDLMKLPANTLMVFNTNDQYGNGKGIYLNMGTATQPYWQAMVPVPVDTNMFIRNQTTQQPNSDFNISGSGAIGGPLTVGSIVQAPGVQIVGTNSEPLTIRTNNPFGTGIHIENAHQSYPDPTYWSLKHESRTSITPDAFTISNSWLEGAKLFTILPNGNTGIKHVIKPTEALEVNGNIKAYGNILIDLEYVRREVTIDGNHNGAYTIYCPAGKKAIGGGGGHRDFNSAIKDINIAYSGPDFYNDPSRWLIYAHNSSGSKRALVVYCACAKVQ